MKKIKLLIINDILLFLSALTVFLSAFVLKYGLPRVTGGQENAFWGLVRHNWFDIHSYGGYIFGALLIIHLILHAGWIKNIGRLWSTN
jgi:hypothetical protein